jgi:ATP-binding cassette, subfamily A (ABC1), member 3
MDSVLKAESQKSDINFANFEDVHQALREQEQNHECLSIRNLVKVFGNGTKAVDGLNVDMYNGQIFALLGHNGAGKTTTISMMTGLIGATKGEANVKNLSIFEEMNAVRKILGICPQHDVLFPKLTAKEHLEIFAAFKGMKGRDIKDEVDKILSDVDLNESKNHLAKNLSGGQKRKLSIGIAFIGDSKLILLDEPTSGMDLTARRHVWGMLKKYKIGKIVILTTHHMVFHT